MKKILHRILNYPAHPISVGALGLLTSQSAYAMNSDQIQSLSDAATSSGDPLTVVIQIVIGIATLIKLFRKNKNESTSN